MEEGTNPVTYCPATVPCVPSHLHVPIIIATDMTVVAPTCITRSWLEMSERHVVIRLTSHAPVLDSLFCFVIRFGWKQELVSMRQCLRRTAISPSGMLDSKQSSSSDLYRKFEPVFSFTFLKFGVIVCN